MSRAKNVECKCESNLTCGHCLRNAKPYHYTLGDGSCIYQLPADISRPGLARAPSNDAAR